MKKLLLLAAVFAFFTCASANAYQAKSSDYEVIQEDDNASTQETTQNIELQYKKLIPLDNVGNEFKFKSQDGIGYYNKNENIQLLTNFDNISLLDKYIKIKNDGKYGIIDKNGTVIIPPVCQKINIIKYNNNEYFISKISGTYQLFYTTGKLVPESEISSIEGKSLYILAEAIRPEFVESYISSHTVYKKLEPEKTQDNLVYEIKEMPLPPKVKAAAVEKNIDEKQVAINDKNSSGENKIKIKDKEYLLTYERSKFGIKNADNTIILPTEYDSISLKNPSEKFNVPLLLTEKNGLYSIFDLSGKLLAEQKPDKIYAYEKNNIYSIAFEENSGELLKNNKLKGIITKEGSDYKYKAKGLSWFTPHKVNELIITLLSVSK